MKKIIFCALIFMISQAHGSSFSDKNIHFPNFEKISSMQWGPIWLPGSSFSSGFNCYEGTYPTKPLNQQVIYRTQIENNPGDETYSVKIAGFHIVGMLIINNPTPHDLSPVGIKWKDVCAGNFVNAQFQGHQISFEFIVPKAGRIGPATLNEVLSESPADLQRLEQFYRPLLKSAQANASERFVDLPYFGSSAYANVDMKDPLAIAISAMSYGKGLGSDKSADIAIIQTVNSF